MNEITKHISNPAVREYFEDYITDVVKHYKDFGDHSAPTDERIIAGLLESTFEMLLTLQAEGIRTNMGPAWVHPQDRPTKECFDKAIQHEVDQFEGELMQRGTNGDGMVETSIEDTVFYYAFHGAAMLNDYNEVRDSLLPDSKDLTYDEIYK